MSNARIKQQFPVHYLVWHNLYEELEHVLTSSEVDIESVDPRGRTPLHLAVTLGHLESVTVLLRHGANANAENSRYWTVVQESIATGDPEIVQLCLQHRDNQRYAQRARGVPALLQKLTESPDFYVEMKWEFTSWVPLVARVCPSDNYRVWKCGSNVRIDTTLLGFDNMNWQRGSRSYVFKGQAEVAVFMEIDHDAHQVSTETIKVLPAQASAIALGSPSQDAVAARLTSPIVTSYIDTEKITFERSKSGLWGWRSDKSEVVSGYDCKVFNASNVHWVTKTRTEHLTEQDKKRSKKASRSPLESFLGVAEEEEKLVGTNNGVLSASFHNPCHITPEEYFDASIDMTGRDIGRPVEQSCKMQRFKAQLCLSENYPLSLPEQVLPIIDLMAASNAHFRKLRDFITLQLPSGFPVKIEIPLFHVLNAKITFGNIFASDAPAPGVTCLRDGDQLMCTIDSSIFDAPSTYSVIGDMHHERLRDEDDELLQFAIQQSLLESGTENDQVTLWEALNKSKSARYSALQTQEEQLLQRALAESMGLCAPLETASPASELSCQLAVLPGAVTVAATVDDDDELLKKALELSEHERREQELRQKQEEEELQRILELSLIDK
jgi:hypothetical protein